MLFNSFVFLFGFLPVALFVHWLAERFAPSWRLVVLALLSFVFYGWWDWRFVPLLAVSILINWWIAELFVRTKAGGLITLAIVGNLLVLALFKYFNFFGELIQMIPGLPAPKLDIALPLGISFFTFHHIMYLTDLRRGEAPRFGLVKYALYISFFPQVLAGPLVRWREIMHQLDERPYQRADSDERIARGIMLLTLGLAKKVLLGDPLAEYANPIFAAAQAGQAISMAEAWQATLAFTFQIYFDFSGYTDMALGLALLLGIVLPQNFEAPYRSFSIQDFWRRANLPMPAPLGWLLTFLFVALCWVLFRAESFAAAMAIYKGLFGFNGLGSGFKWRALLPAAAVAVIGPTAWAFVHRLPPRRWIAIAFAVLFVAVLFKIGDDANYEFIYFQF